MVKMTPYEPFAVFLTALYGALSLLWGQACCLLVLFFNKGHHLVVPKNTAKTSFIQAKDR